MEYPKKTNDSQGELNPGFEKLMGMLPHRARDFDGTEMGQPAAMAYLGRKADAESLRKQAESLRASAPEQMCETAMLMAEIIESADPDRDKYFQTDSRTRNHVFMGSKWRAGWVLLMGGGDHTELAQKFRQKEFLVFAQNGRDLPGVIDLGPRETACVYFLQLMVRYAMTWGEIQPGDDHEMGHFLERDMPGVVVADGKLTPVEELLLLGLMKMGAPAVVPPNYPWDLGRHVRAAGSDQIVEAATKFPNLRVKDIQGKIITLPAHCNPANAKAPFEAEATIGGQDSFFVLMPGEVEDGVQLPEDCDLTHSDAIGIVIEAGDKRLDVAASEYVEKEALRAINATAGLRAEQSKEGRLVIRCAKEARPDASMIAEALRSWLPYQFPYLERVHVKILVDDDARELGQTVDEFRAMRQKAISDESDDTVKHFNYCLECQPFSKDHVCIITPDRPPMCGRDRFQVKTAVLFGASWHPWKRRELEDQEIRGAIEAGDPIDANKGEYATVNKAVQRLSPGHIKRVQLHSVREFPHTSCGCFGFLTFWIESLNGIGVMERDYQGEGPEGVTWNYLANAAGGKQCPGIVGVSRNYLRSKRFMQGEGGLDAVRWLSPKAFDALKDRLPQADAVKVGPVMAPSTTPRP